MTVNYDDGEHRVNRSYFGRCIVGTQTQGFGIQYLHRHPFSPKIRGKQSTPYGWIQRR